MDRIADTFMAYQFIKRLNTPFEHWEAFRLGVIDDTGKAIIKRPKLTDEQRKSWGRFDVLVANLKRLLAKLPGGSTKLATLAATVMLLKEETLDENNVDLLAEQLDHNIALLKDEMKLPTSSLFEGFRILNKTSEAPEGTGIPHKVEKFHQSRANGWCVQVLDKHDNQVGDAEYHYHKTDAEHARKGLVKHHNLNESDDNLLEARRNPGAKMCGHCGQGDLHTREVRLNDDGRWSQVRQCSLCGKDTTIRPKAKSAAQQAKHQRSIDFINQLANEDAACNAVGGGAIAGVGVGPQGEPGKTQPKKKRKPGELPTTSLFTRKTLG